MCLPTIDQILVINSSISYLPVYKENQLIKTTWLYLDLITLVMFPKGQLNLIIKSHQLGPKHGFLCFNVHGGTMVILTQDSFGLMHQTLHISVRTLNMKDPVTPTTLDWTTMSVLRALVTNIKVGHQHHRRKIIKCPYFITGQRHFPN